MVTIMEAANILPEMALRMAVAEAAVVVVANIRDMAVDTVDTI